MAEQSEQFAVVAKVKLDMHVIAICDVITYDTWGNARDGFEVNDAHTSQRNVEIPVQVEMHGVPRFPGAKDKFRTFPAGESFSVNVVVSYELVEREVLKLFGPGHKIDDNASSPHCYYVNKKSNDKPVGEVRVTGWKEGDENEKAKK